MRISDFYARTPIKVENEIYALIDSWHPHVPEVNEDDLDSRKNRRIQVRIYFDPHIDGERCCTIGAAYFDDKPVMLFRHGGRGGHDQYDEFVTDRALYGEMVQYMRAELVRDGCQKPIPHTYDPDVYLRDLDHFYNHNFPGDMS
jgi:hypothetical protein